MISLKEIAACVDGRIIGSEDRAIYGISSIKDAEEGEITYLADLSYRKHLQDCRASAIIVGKDFPTEETKNADLIIVDHPALAYMKVAGLFMKLKERVAGVSNLAAVDGSASISESASVAPFVFVGKNSTLAASVTLYPFVHIGENVVVGEGTTLYPQVTILDNVTIGKNVIIHSGTVIGSDGFGYIWDGSKHAKIPQIGKVVIEDDVEIGANTAIDRASLGQTLIRKGTKIDNLVQIAHNVSIGENSIIVSQVGIAGSAIIGRNVVLAGQTGVRDHAVIGDGVMAGGRAGITGDVPAGSLISGTPHMPHKEWLRQNSYLKKLPQLFKRLRRIERNLNLEDKDD